MAFKRESLASLLDKAYANYMSLLKPMERTPRYNLIKVLSSIQAGTRHQMLGDLAFLADQVFPDTATGEYLRGHWSDRVPALYANSAVGTVIQTGAGLLTRSAPGAFPGLGGPVACDCRKQQGTHSSGNCSGFSPDSLLILVRTLAVRPVKEPLSFACAKL